MDITRSYSQTRYVYNPNREPVWKEICRYLQKRYIPVTSKILDVGAGYCHFINNIPGAEKHALDTSPIILEYANENVITHVQSCTNMESISSDFFDVVFASNLFEHLTREELCQTLSELNRVLKPKGNLILIQPNYRYCYREYFDDYTHLQVFSHIAMCDLLKVSGFDIIDMKPRILPFSLKSSLPKSPILVRLYLRLPCKPFAGQMLIVATNHKQQG